MAIGFFDILGQLATYPTLGVILVLVMLVTIISGATDAPNAIATAVSTRCMKPGTALIVAAICNFVGMIVMTFISTSVAETMFNMVNFTSADAHVSLLALMAAMIASIFWGTLCWFLGIPASKSHSLIAGITGGAIALNGFEGVVIGEWMKVIYGMVFSLVAGFILGFVFVKIIEKIFCTCNRSKGNVICRWIQNICAVLLAGLHGAQDGQKFMSIAVMGISLVIGSGTSGGQFPMWLMILCSAMMGLGTLIGGKRIIKSVAMDMVQLEKYQGVASSLSTTLMLLIASLTGMPVSTSHCNTSSIMGVGTAKNAHDVKWKVAGNMVLAWILTFPCCGIIGFVFAKIFIMF
ncbi:MAG: inorganic phosphate transporter [Coriobacteriia bacterium]|nr:inorganic phosphate transporter [Coriobacteriia bacterium]